MTEKQENLASNFSWWLIAATFIVLIYLLGPILSPFLIAAIFAYICNPLVDRISTWQVLLWRNTRFSFNRTLASAIVMVMLFLIFLALLLVIVPLFQREIVKVIEQLPEYIAKIRGSLEPWILRHFGVSLNIDAAQLQKMLSSNWKSASTIVGDIMLSIGSHSAAVISWVVNLLLIPLVLFYMLRDWHNMIRHISTLIPRKFYAKSALIASQIDKVLAEFLRGQLTVMLVMSAFYAIGLRMAGLELALPIGVLSGLLGFVPYLGIGIGMLLAVFSGLLEFNTLSELIPVLVVFGLGQIIESYWLTPNLVGDRIGLHPVIVIFALLAGGQLFGFTGVLLALPASAAIAVALRHVRTSYLESGLYSKPDDAKTKKSQKTAPAIYK
jgi:predicted PurR-regulated permease PerM